MIQTLELATRRMWYLEIEDYVTKRHKKQVETVSSQVMYAPI